MTDAKKRLAVALIRASERKQGMWEGVESGGAAKRRVQPPKHILRAIEQPLRSRVLGADGEIGF